MAVSIYQIGYKKLSQIIFEWQAADRASLLALFMVMEIVMHWLWCLLVWSRQDAFGTYVDMEILYPIWLSITLMGLFFWWMVGHLSHIKNNNKRLHKWQIVLILAYSLYIAGVIVVMGHSSLVSGISLVGGAMLGMMLIRRKYVWYAFWLQIFLILLVSTIPYLGIRLPDLRQLTMSSILIDGYSYVTYSEMTTIENMLASSIFKNGSLNWDSVNQLCRSSAFFWRSTHMYLALPKAIFIVYVFRTLLLILDNSKAEILQHANHDELTTLKSRRYGLKKMQQTLMATTEAQDYSVILLDLDLFKNINDSHGHEVGDLVLREVSQVLMTTLVNIDLVSRYGGEEFLIILPNTAHDDAMLIAEQLRHNISQHTVQVDDSFSFQVTASLGLYTLTHAELIAIKKDCVSKNPQTITPKNSRLKLIKSRNVKVPHLSESPEALLPCDICQRLITIADRALYRAKDLGRNQVISANHLIEAGHMPNMGYGT